MKWNELTMSQKSDLMKLYLKSGITSLDDMQRHYDKYAEGGPLDNNPPISDKARKAYEKSAKRMIKLQNLYGEKAVYEPNSNDFKNANHGIAQATFLMPKDLQREIFRAAGFIENPGDYGLVNNAVAGRDIPVYQTKEDDIKRNKLTVLGNQLQNDLIYGISEDGQLGDANYYPIAYYVDSRTGEPYVKGWDLNDYSGTKNTTASKLIQGIHTIGGNVLDAVGNPTVVTTGFRKFEDGYIPPEVEALMYKKKGLVNTNIIEDNAEGLPLWSLPPITITPNGYSVYNPEEEGEDYDYFFNKGDVGAGYLYANGGLLDGDDGEDDKYSWLKPKDVPGTTPETSSTIVTLEPVVDPIYNGTLPAVEIRPAYFDSLTAYDWARANSLFKNDLNARARFLENVGTKRMTGQSQFMKDTDRLAAIPIAATAGAGGLAFLNGAAGAKAASILLGAIGVTDVVEDVADKNYKSAAVNAAMNFIPIGKIAKGVKGAMKVAKRMKFDDAFDLIPTHRGLDSHSIPHNTDVEPTTVLSHSVNQQYLEHLIDDDILFGEGVKRGAPSIAITNPNFNFGTPNAYYTFYFEPKYIDAMPHVASPMDAWTPDLPVIQDYLHKPYNSIDHTRLVPTEQEMLDSKKEIYNAFGELVNAKSPGGTSSHLQRPQNGHHSIWESKLIRDMSNNPPSYGEALPLDMVDLTKAKLVTGPKPNKTIEDFFKYYNLNYHPEYVDIPGLKFSKGGCLQPYKDNGDGTATIQEGDTMYDIAQAEGMNIDYLLAANPQVDPTKLQVGQTINLLNPLDKYYVYPEYQKKNR